MCCDVSLNQLLEMQGLHMLATPICLKLDCSIPASQAKSFRSRQKDFFYVLFQFPARSHEGVVIRTLSSSTGVYLFQNLEEAELLPRACHKKSKARSQVSFRERAVLDAISEVSYYE